MVRRLGLLAGAAALAVAATVAAPEARAACATLSFSVNDYGKQGPTRDALALLDRYIADWTREKGIKSYSVGKKDVSCELYLDLLVFDEHTCKAKARVCWGGSGAPAGRAPARALGSKPAG
jgi:hypothetical protein